MVESAFYIHVFYCFGFQNGLTDYKNCDVTKVNYLPSRGADVAKMEP